MNQKNIFPVIGAILVLQGIFFYFMGEKMALQTFPDLNDSGVYAVKNILQVLSMVSITVGLISFAARNTPQVLWAYTIGFSLFAINSLKHLLVDEINVPIPALVIQLAIALVSAYLWSQNKKPTEA